MVRRKNRTGMNDNFDGLPRQTPPRYDQIRGGFDERETIAADVVTCPGLPVPCLAGLAGRIEGRQ